MSRGLFLASIITLFLLTMATTQASLYIEAPSSTIVYQPVVVTVEENGTPVKDVTVYFVLNGGVPVYTKTNESGQTVFKPIAPGTLDVIIAERGKIIAKKVILVYSKAPKKLTNVNKTSFTEDVATPVGVLPVEIKVEFRQNVTGQIQVTGGTLESYTDFLNETNPGAKERIFENISEILGIPPELEIVRKYVPIVLFVNATPEVRQNVSRLVINITIPRNIWEAYGMNFTILKFENNGSFIEKNDTPKVISLTNESVTLQAEFKSLSLYVVAAKTAPLPDLTVSLLPQKTEVIPGEEVGIDVIVRNSGTADAYNVKVLFNSKLTTIPTLTKNAERKLVFTWTAPSTPGTYTIKAIVDPDNDIIESNENNNIATTTIVVKAVVGVQVPGAAGGGGYVTTISPPLIAPSVIKYETSMYVTKGKSEVIALPKTYVEQTDITKVIATFDFSGTVYLAVSKVKELPAEIPTPKYPVYGYVEIVFYDITGKEVTAKSYEVEFRVSKKWLEENNCKPEQVVLMKFDETWKELPTSIVSEDANYYYFKAEAKTFSIFAIAAKPVVITPTTTIPVVTTPPTLVTTPPPAPPTLTYIAIAIIVIVVIVAIIALARRR